jgi:PAS domain S-box-containing protein
MLGRFLPQDPRALEPADVASALEVILWTLMTSILLLAWGLLLLPDFTGRWLTIIAAMYALCVPALVLNRRGHTRFASTFLVAGLWVICTAATLTAGGLASLASSFFVVIVFVAGLVLGARAGAITALVCIVTLLGVLVVEMTGRLPWTVLPYTSPTRGVYLTLLLAMVTGFQYLAARTIGNALRRSREEVAERKRAEEALTIAKEWSEGLINTIDGIVWEADAKTFQFTFISPQAERFLGYPSSQWLRDPTFWKDHLHPDDRDDAVGYCVASTAALRAHDFEYRMIAADGREVWLRDIVTVLAEHNEPKTLRGIMVDITMRKRVEEELRRNEELFRAVVEDQTEMIVRWKPDGTRTFVNRAYCHVFGKNPEDLIGTSFLPLVVEAYREGIREKTRSLTPDQPLATEIHESISPNGETCWQEWTDRGIFDAAGRLVELQSTGRDITERMRAEEALRTLTEQLRALSARLQSAREEEGKRIAREIHDELGGALTGLKWDLDTIEKTLSGVDAGGELHWIREKIPVMTDLIESTITIVRRISSDLRPAMLDDLGVIAAIEWHVQQFQSRTGIPCDCETTLEAADLDRERATAVFRICQEILTNVLRHAHATRVHVQIREESGRFVLDVKDNGRGITEDEQLGTRSLGLLGMRERALLVGGDVAIRGSEGKGTNVIVRVPIAS